MGDHHFGHLFLEIAVSAYRQPGDGIIGFTGEGLVNGIRLSTPGPAVSKSTSGLESVVARMMVLRILVGIRQGGDGVGEAAGGFAHLLCGSSRPMATRAAVGRLGVWDDKLRVDLNRLRNIAVGEFEVLRPGLRRRARYPPGRAGYLRP
jgi:hypothetical protein